MRSTHQAVIEHLGVLVTDLGPTGVQRDERVFMILKDEKLPLDKQLSELFRRWGEVMGREPVRSEHLAEGGNICRRQVI